MQKNYPLYQHKELYTLKELVEYIVDEYKDKPAIVFPKNRKEDITKSYIELKNDIHSFGAYLLNKGYQNCKIAVYGNNSYEWIITYFAAVCGKNIVVPIDKELGANDVDYLLKDSECSLLIFADDKKEVISNLSFEIETISFSETAAIINQSSNSTAEYENIEVLPDDLASIVYTSGTTGKPKGVMLTHHNFIADTYGAMCNALITGSGILLLPLHHTFGLVAGLFAELYYGTPLYINSSFKRLTKDFQKVKPQHLFCVPLIVETLHKNIWANAKKQGKEKTLQKLIKLSNFLLKIGIDLRKVFFKSVISAFGGNLNLLISGGAPIDNKYIEDFNTFGITVLNGYGITECGPIVAVNRNEFVVKDSVGPPLPCNEVKIADDGEVLVKGTNLMLGYYHDEDENQNSFIDDWFKTGDLGFIDELGTLHIVGRKKNLIILDNGKNVSAEELEGLISKIDFVTEVIVYGKDNRITAEIYSENNESERIEEEIQRLNKSLVSYKQIDDIVFRNTPFEKTTTKKIKRN